MEPHDYLLGHSQKLSEEYPGKYLAIVDEKVVAVSSSGHDAFEKAKKSYPGKEIYITYMPTDEETVTLLFERFKICFDEKEKVVEFYRKA